MKLVIDKEQEYIPSWNDNEADDEPIKFILSNLTTTERDACVDLSFGENGDPLLKPDMQRIFAKGVKRIENLWVNGGQISTPAAMMAAPGLYELFLEVASEILARNMRHDPKNLPSPSTLH